MTFKSNVASSSHPETLPIQISHESSRKIPSMLSGGSKRIRKSSRGSNSSIRLKRSYEVNEQLIKTISIEKQIKKLQQTISDSFDTNQTTKVSRISQKLASVGPLQINDLEEFLKKSKIDFDKLFCDNTKCDLTLSDFTIIKKIGKGSFGKVFLAELSLDETLYAIKLIDKRAALQNKSVRYVINEKRVLQSVNFPFLVQLKCFFVDYKNLYFVMPFIPGGDFNNYLFKKKVIQEDHTKFYIGQLILAIEYLHYMGLIHRDVKPENIIIDVFGYLKLVDFGQCIKCYDNDKTWTHAGTPEYMAPEVIVGKGYDCAVDWWSLGVITFQVCAGKLPFVGKNINSLYKQILTVSYQFPDHFSRQLKSFVKSLLVNNPADRIANQSRRASKLKTMSWLKNVDWFGLLNRTIEAPYLPDITDFSTRKKQNKT